MIGDHKHVQCSRLGACDEGIEVPTSALPSVLALGDFDTDGRLDIALGTPQGPALLFNRGQASFELLSFADAPHSWLSL